jgi:hypothetical protein
MASIAAPLESVSAPSDCERLDAASRRRRLLLALELTVHEDDLPRPHDLRGLPLHLSLIFEHELSEELAAAAQRLDVRWRGATVAFEVKRFGNGGTAILSENDPLLHDTDFQALYEAGFYSYKEPHVSL